MYIAVALNLWGNIIVHIILFFVKVIIIKHFNLYL